MSMRVLLLIAICFSPLALALKDSPEMIKVYRNNCLLYQHDDGDFDILINDVKVISFARGAGEQAQEAMKLIKDAGACVASNCAIGKIGSSETLAKDGQPLNFFGNSAKDAAVGFANLVGINFCRVYKN
jgi:hypothetical protein